MLEKKFENIFMEKLIENGYEFLGADETLNERRTIEQILLINLIEESIKRLNPMINQKNMHEVIKQIKSVSSSDLIIANEAVMAKIIYGVKIFDHDRKMTITYKIVYFDNVENNHFMITNQFNCFNFISDKFNNKYGTITSSYDRFFNWFNKKKSDNLLNNFINGLLAKETILDIVKNYLFFTIDNKNSVSKKIIAAYHQYQGVNAAIKQIKQNSDHKGGIFWHTQGAGKSFSMVFLTRKYITLFSKATVLIVTDRKDLDLQLYDNFINSRSYLGQVPERIESIKQLKEKLDNKKQNGIYLSTIQKFTEKIGILSSRKDILIIADEAHRSHNLDNDFRIDKDSLEVHIKEGNAQRLRKALVNATFIGFTGTPIEWEDRSTKNIFGDYVSKYLMYDAINDGTIVDIFYESRKKELHRNVEEFEKIDQEYELIKEKYKNETFMFDEAIKTLGSKLNTFEKLIENDDRIAAISADFIEHYKTRINILKGKALFVAFNRKCAIKYYHEIIKQAPELKDNIRVIMTSNKQVDSDEVLKLIGRDKDKKVFAKEFKDSESNFKIAILVDMWLNGFDVPCLDVIYLDKWLKMHNLMQAIARVNRVYEDEKKIKLNYRV